MLRDALCAVILLLAVLCCAPPRSAASSPDLRPLVKSGSLQKYKLAWHDEFDGDRLQAREWSPTNRVRFWSAERADNVSVADGKLRLALIKESFQGKDYTCGGVVSKRAFKYGYYEIRCKMPPGKGWHTGFWLVGEAEEEGARQEIDVCENDSIDPRSYTFNLQLWLPRHSSLGAQRVAAPDLAADYHVFGCQFTSKRVTYFLDGDAMGWKDVATFEHDEMNIRIASVAADLNGTDRVDDAALPACVLVDWVRYYRP